jgi:hypothetical protein
MIIWGLNTKNIGAIPLTGECTTCHQSALHLTAFQSMFHLFWIPTIPLKKSYQVFCAHCGTQYNPEIFANYQEFMQNASTKFKRPWWSFSGLGLVGLLAVWLAYLAQVDRKVEQDFRHDPHAGDLIVLKTTEGSWRTPYTFAKVVTVDANTVMLNFSAYAYSSSSMAERSARNNLRESLSTETQDLSREDLQALPIVKVIR